MGASSSTTITHVIPPPQNIYDTFTAACRTKNIPELSRLLQNSAQEFYEYIADGRSRANAREPPLFVGARYGDMQVMNLILSYFPDERDNDLNGMTPLIVACKFGNEGAVKVLLEHGVDVNYISSTGNTALTMAIKTDLALHIVSMLCKGILLANTTKSHKPITKWKNGKFVELVNARRLMVVRLLLDYNACVHQVDGDGLNALLACCKYDQCGVLKCLLQRKAYMDDACHAAVTLRHVPDITRQGILTAAFATDDERYVVQQLIDNDHGSDGRGDSSASPCITYGYGRGSGSISANGRGVDIDVCGNGDGNSDIIDGGSGSHNGNAGNMGMLEDPDSENSRNSVFPNVFPRCRNRSVEIQEQASDPLLSLSSSLPPRSTTPTIVTTDGVECTNEGCAALILAVQSGHCGVIKLLLQHGAHAQCVHARDGTLLGMACERQRLDIVFLLLGIEDPRAEWTGNGKISGSMTGKGRSFPRKEGAQPPQHTHAGLSTPSSSLPTAPAPLLSLPRFSLPFTLSLSSSTPSSASSSPLPSVDINQQDCVGRTALMRAAWSGWLTGVSFLLYSGADPHIMDRQGDTALLYLFEGLKYRVQPQRSMGKYQLHHDILRMFDLLHDAGANINHRNKFGVDILIRACENVHNASIIRYLLNLVTITPSNWRKCVDISKKKTKKETLEAVLTCTPRLLQQTSLSDEELMEVAAVALWTAVEYNLIAICRIILAIRCCAAMPSLPSPDKTVANAEMTVLMLAATLGHEEIVKALLYHVGRVWTVGVDETKGEEQHILGSIAKEAVKEVEKHEMIELTPREPLFEWEDESSDELPLLLQYEL